MNTAANSTNDLSPTKRALLALKEMQAKLEATERAKREPIAIIGMGCRLPGGAVNPDAYWDLLVNQKDAITEVPGDRWDVDAYYDPDPDTPGKIYTRYGSFVDDVDQFDPSFFSISPREALTMDPQQRLLLEVAWEALEDANQVPEQLFNSPTGVFVGICTNDYTKVALGPGAQGGESIDAYFATGNAHSVASGRLSYIFGFTGPSLAVDTACSSSLVSVHLACQSLRSRECNLALAGGVNLLLSPQTTMTFSKAKMMAPDGRCKTFDAAANGYVRGEGCGVIVLKRLSDAIADGDRILAVIRGSAVNQDGPSGGLTVPNGPSQEKVLRQALQNGAVNPAEVAYIEAHGTGTSLGDPIEVEALGSVFGSHRPADNPLKIGSVKTNIGHLEAAAGIAGLIKVVLSLNHELIPSHLHFREPNPYINWSQLPIQVTATATPWPRSEQPRLAGVSSFGFSGTNAHVLIEEAPPAAPLPEVTSDRPQHLLTLSAKSAPALAQLAQRYQTYLQKAENSLPFASICYTANTQRSQFEHRLSLVAATAPEAAEQLLSFSVNADDSKVISGRVTGTPSPGPAFLFTGQGSQYSGMGQQLYQSQPVFRQALDDCHAKLQPLLGVSLLDLLFNPAQAETLNQTAYTQPALFALEYALAQMWLSWGVKPAALMGHSVGEYVAACIAGVFSLDEGLKLIAERGRLMQALPAGGGMVSVLAPEATVREYLAPYAGQVTFAAINGPTSVVIAGPTAALETITSKLEQASIKVKPLVVSHAFHSPLMEPMLKAFEAVARQIDYQPPRLKLISNVTGKVADQEVATAEYWCRHIRQPVMFAAGMQTLHQLGLKTFLEMGPKPILLGMGRQCVPVAENQQWLPSLRPPLSDWQVLLASLGQLYVQGANIDWHSFEQGYPRQRVSLPTYAFQRQRYWVESEAQPLLSVAAVVSSAASSALHPLLGNRLRSAIKVIQFEALLRANAPAFLTDHQVAETVILPATAYCEMALAAGATVDKAGHISLESVAIHQPLVLAPEGAVVVHCVLTPETETAYKFEIFSLAAAPTEASSATDEVWTLHADGLLLTAVDPVSPAAQSVPDTAPTLADGETLYEQFRQQGFNYGPAFQGVKQVWRTETEVVGKIQLPAQLADEVPRYQLHPALLDACFQILGATVTEADLQSLYLPVGIGQLQVHQPVESSLWCRAENLRAESNHQVLRTNLVLFNDSGTVMAEVTDLTLRRVNRQALMRSLQPDLTDWLYRIDWQPLEAPAVSETINAGDGWLIFADGDGVAEALVESLEKAGAVCVQVLQGTTYRQTSSCQFEVNPTKLEDFQRLVTEGLPAGAPCKGIVYLWGATATTELTEEQVVRSQPAICGGVLHLVQALLQGSTPALPPLWLVSRGTQPIAGIAPTQPQTGSLWGLGRVLMVEHPDLRCHCIDLDIEPASVDSQQLLAEITTQAAETQVAYRQSQRYGARLVRYQAAPLDAADLTVPQSPYQVRIREYGILENLQLVPTERRVPGPDEVEIAVRAVGLNFRDVLNALGMMKSFTEAMGVTDTADVPFGGECAGVVTAVGANVQHLAIGDEVIAAQALGSLSSHVIVAAAFVVTKPAGLSYEAAATIPTAFLTAYHALHHQAQLQPGERVLVHAAAGGVGQAAVQIAQWLGAEVWGTASEPKWTALKEKGVTQIFNSRTLEFADQITTLTDGAGVNVVLNSLNGDFIPKTLSVLGTAGRFVEIGKIGIWSPEQVAEERPDVSYLPFDLLDISLETPGNIGQWLADLMPLFEQDKLQPLTHQVFPIEQLVSAFRYMAQAKHIGKVVISLPAAASDLADAAEAAVVTTIRRTGTYLVTGGLGALGQQVARWLAQQGAQHIVLTGRRVPTEAPILSELEQQGVQVQAIAADISQRGAIADLMQRLKTTMPPLKGIFHVAGVLDDGMVAGQTWEQFERVMAPKVMGTWWLHEQTQNLDLDCFVCFSSVAAVVGSPGQANYAAANAFMDALAAYRQGLGLPGLSINWGPWSQSGMAAALQSRDQARWAAQGVGLIEPGQGVALLSQLVATAKGPQAIVLPVDWSRYLAQMPPEMTPPLLELVAQNYSAGAKVASFLPELQAAIPSQRRSLLLHHVQSNLAKVLGLPSAEELDPQQGLADLGMDSLMAVELRNRLQSSLGCPVPPTVVFDYPTITALVDYLAEVLQLDTADTAEDNDLLLPLETTSPAAAPTGTATDDLSDSEAEALLLQKLDSMRY